MLTWVSVCPCCGIGCRYLGTRPQNLITPPSRSRCLSSSSQPVALCQTTRDLDDYQRSTTAMTKQRQGITMATAVQRPMTNNSPASFVVYDDLFRVEPALLLLLSPFRLYFRIWLGMPGLTILPVLPRRLCFYFSVSEVFLCSCFCLVSLSSGLLNTVLDFAKWICHDSIGRSHFHAPFMLAVVKMLQNSFVETFSQI